VSCFASSSSSCPVDAACVGTSVACPVLGSVPDGAVIVVVAEVPRCTGWDVLTASPAVDLSGGDEGCPLGAESLVLGAVPACRGPGRPTGPSRPALLFAKDLRTQAPPRR